jgi:hypothetical protein
MMVKVPPSEKEVSMLDTLGLRAREALDDITTQLGMCTFLGAESIQQIGMHLAGTTRTPNEIARMQLIKAARDFREVRVALIRYAQVAPTRLAERTDDILVSLAGFTRLSSW